MTRQSYKIIGYTLLCVLLLSFFSCTPKTEFAGIYRTDTAAPEKQSELVLKEDGEGIWRVGEDTEIFSWYIKGDEIRLNTRKGGVIVANIHDDRLEIELSPEKTLTFRKIKKSDVSVKPF